MKRASVILLLFVVFDIPSYSQAHLFKNYNVEDGLLLGQVRQASQDCFGRIWIVTENGLNYMENNEWKTFYLPSAFNRAVYFGMFWDSKCNLWISSNLGLIKYNGTKFQVHRYFSADVKNIANTFYEYSDSTIWAAFEEGGISFISNGKARHFTKQQGFTNSRVTGIYKTLENKFLLSTIDEGLYEYDGKTFRRFLIPRDSFQKVSFQTECSTTKMPTHSDSLFPKNIRKMFYDKKGTIWMIESARLYSWNGRYLTNYCLGTDRRFHDIDQDPSGKIWVASDIGLFTISENKIDFIGAEEGLVNDQVYDIFIDREKVLWVSTYANGLFRSLGNHFSSLSISPLLRNKSFSAIVRDNSGNLLAGTSNEGMYVVSGNKIKNYNASNSILPNKINALLKDYNGNIFIATGKGVYKYNRTFTKVDTACKDCLHDVRTLAMDLKGKLWFASQRGVYSYDKKLKKEIDINKLSHRVVYSLMFASDSSLYLGTFLGLDVYRNGVVTKSKHTVFRDSHVVGMIEETPGLIWFSIKNAGLIRWQKNTNEFLHIQRKDGLQSDYIHTLNVDEHKNVYASSSAGMDKISFKNANQFQITNFNRQHGFYGVTPSFYNSFIENGQLIYGTMKGIFRYNKLDVSLAKPVAFPFIFREIKVNDRPLNLDSATDYITALNRGEKSFSYKENNIAFALSVNSTLSHQLYTRFKLIGFDKQWSNAAKLSEIKYTNLPSGKYELNVAFSPDAITWSDIYRYQFVIQFPFWKKWWFYALVVLTVIMLGRTIHILMLRSKIRKVMEKEKYKKDLLDQMRKNIAMDFHDDLGNQLASLRIYANMISIQLKDKTPALGKLLHNIDRSSDKLFQGTKDFIWSINPQSDSLVEIYTYLKDFGEEIFSNVNIDFYGNNTLSDNLNLPSGWSRHIVLIFKEAMTNALKHSVTTTATLEFRKNGEHLELSFSDNGKGIPENGKAGKGLQNMKKRAAAIDADLNIDTSKNGVSVILKLINPSNHT